MAMQNSVHGLGSGSPGPHRATEHRNGNNPGQQQFCSCALVQSRCELDTMHVSTHSFIALQAEPCSVCRHTLTLTLITGTVGCVCLHTRWFCVSESKHSSYPLSCRLIHHQSEYSSSDKRSVCTLSKSSFSSISTFAPNSSITHTESGVPADDTPGHLWYGHHIVLPTPNLNEPSRPLQVSPSECPSTYRVFWPYSHHYPSSIRLTQIRSVFTAEGFLRNAFLTSILSTVSNRAPFCGHPRTYGGPWMQRKFDRQVHRTVMATNRFLRILALIFFAISVALTPFAFKILFLSPITDPIVDHA